MPLGELAAQLTVSAHTQTLTLRMSRDNILLRSTQNKNKKKSGYLINSTQLQHRLQPAWLFFCSDRLVKLANITHWLVFF